MSAPLAGKTILITGASSGIGAATARACAGAGMRVIASARRGDRLASLAKEVALIVPIVCDVSTREACEALVERATREVGPLDVVFANAGYGEEAPVLAMPEERLRAMLDTNFWGSYWLARAALPAMLARGSGHVLLCSSCLSKIALPNLSAYTMSKSMQDHLGRALRHELRGTGVHVSTVHPIGTRTEFFDEAARRSTKAAGSLRTPEAFMQHPERVARAVVACLRSPKGEVWTSATVRLALGLATAFPGVTDWALARRGAK